MKEFDTDALIQVLRANKPAISHALKIKPVRQWRFVPCGDGIAGWVLGSWVRITVGYRYFVDGKEVKSVGDVQEIAR